MILYENYTLNAENINLDLSDTENCNNDDNEIRYGETEDLPNYNFISNSQQVGMTQSKFFYICFKMSFYNKEKILKLSSNSTK